MRARRAGALLVAIASLAAACSNGGGEPDLDAAGSDAPVELPHAPGFDGETIRVAVLGPTSGPMAEAAAERAAGLRAFLDYVTLGLGGVAGKYPVVLDVVDSAEVAEVPAAYERLRSETALVAQVQGRAAVEALRPALAAAEGLAVPAPADVAWVRDAALLPMGTPDQLAAGNAISWVLEEGGLPEDASLCSAVQDGADGEGWAEGLERATGPGRLNRAVTAAIAIPAAPTSARGVLDQFDQVVAAGCDVVLLVAAPTTTSDVLTAAAGAESPIRWVVPSTATSIVLPNKPIEGYLAEHLVVVGDGPVTDDPLGLPELIRIRDGYAPGLELGGAFTAGYLHGKAVVAVLEAAVSQGDLSAAGLRAAASRLRSVSLDELAPAATFGAAERRQVPTTSTLSTPDPSSPTRLRPVGLDHSAPFADDLAAELLTSP